MDKHLTDFVKEKFIALFEQGIGYLNIALKIKITEITVVDLIQKWKNLGTIKSVLL